MFISVLSGTFFGERLNAVSHAVHKHQLVFQ